MNAVPEGMTKQQYVKALLDELKRLNDNDNANPAYHSIPEYVLRATKSEAAMKHYNFDTRFFDLKAAEADATIEDTLFGDLVDHNDYQTDYKRIERNGSRIIEIYEQLASIGLAQISLPDDIMKIDARAYEIAKHGEPQPELFTRDSEEDLAARGL